MADRVSYIENAIIAADTLTDLYAELNWTAYSNHPDKMAGLLAGSLWHMSAWVDDYLVGLIRCVGDDRSILYIQDILVREAFQRQGIGSHLINKTLERFSHIRQTVLLTDVGDTACAFYQALGFELANQLRMACFVRLDQSK